MWGNEKNNGDEDSLRLERKEKVSDRKRLNKTNASSDTRGMRGKIGSEAERSVFLKIGKK